ncbi:EAL domain-containing protein [Aliikangiella sp. IMCC44653]
MLALDISQVTERSVVVFDPDSTIMSLIEKNLNEQDISLCLAESKAQLSLLLERLKPNVIILPECIKNSCGFQICREIEPQSKGIGSEIFMLTQGISPDESEKAFSNGASDFMPLPFCTETFRQRTFHLITKSTTKQNEKTMFNQITRYDALTGLTNRQSFVELVNTKLAQARNSFVTSGLLVIDLDNFKRFNDTLGHDFGDKLLVEISKKLSKALRSSDIFMVKADSQSAPEQLARIGGNLFTIYLENIEAQSSLERIAKRLVKTINQPITINQQEVVVSPSIGVSMYPKDGTDVKCLLRNAEKAMYIAKSKGGCGYRTYDMAMNASARKRLRLETDLRKALAKDELHLHYQPQIDSRTGRVTSVEALLRWSHPTLGLVSPDEFIPIAEESGLIVNIGNWVLFNACAQAKLWLDKGAHFTRMAVNVSACQFDHPNFLDNVFAALKENKLSACHLELELTESIIMSNLGESVQKLLRLKEMGIRLAVDDFGTGYSSLSYLKSLPIDTLKIDRSFIGDISEASEDCAIVSAIMALAEKLKLKVVAEGVEDICQINFLKHNYCALLQGYYFSRPNSASVIERLLINQYKEAIHVDSK